MTTDGAARPDELVAQLHALGIRPGDTLLVHASLSAVGPVLGGARAVADSLLEALGADGTVVTASETQNADLFWALRGGGGGNFGVVTSHRMAATPAPTLSRFSLTWTWEQAADMLTAWQQWAIASPRKLSSGPVLALFDAAPGTTPFVGVSGVWMGGPAELPPLLDTLVGEVGHAPSTRTVNDDTYTAGMPAGTTAPT